MKTTLYCYYYFEYLKTGCIIEKLIPIVKRHDASMYWSSHSRNLKIIFGITCLKSMQINCLQTTMLYALIFVNYLHWGPLIVFCNIVFKLGLNLKNREIVKGSSGMVSVVQPRHGRERYKNVIKSNLINK